MSIALTFFKKRGSKDADEFRGVIGYRGSPLNEWDYLSLDPQLREIRVKLLVREYSDAAELDAPYNTIVKKPICLDLRYDAGKSEQYPDKSDLNSTSIKTWILSTLKSRRPESLTPEITEVDRIDSSSTPQSGPVTGNDNNSSLPSSKPEGNGDAAEIGQEDNRGLLGLGLGLAGTLLVAAMAVAGAVGGSLMADRDDEASSSFLATDLDEDGNGEMFFVAEEDEDAGVAQKLNFKKLERQRREIEKRDARLAAKGSGMAGPGNGKNPWEEAPPTQPIPSKVQIQQRERAGTADDPTIGF